MTPFDFLLIIFGVGIVVFGAFQRMLRMLFMLAVVWLATYGVTNPQLVLGVFLVLFMLLTIAGYAVSRLAFPITKLPKIGFLDVLMGGLIGAAVAALVLSLVFNTLGFMVNERWEVQTQTWYSLRSQFLGARLLPYIRQVMNYYAWTFTFFYREFPAVLVPR